MKHLDVITDRAIKLIQKASDIANEMSKDGFYVAFSGGKDSIVLKDLFIKSRTKCHFEMSVTTLDTPEVMQYIRKHHKDVHINIPHYDDGSTKTFFTELERRNCIPSRYVRWCCKSFKEDMGVGCVCATGVRMSESANRKIYNPMPMKMLGKSKVIQQHTSVFSEPSAKDPRHTKNIDLWNIDQNTLHQCVNGADKILLQPIFDWTDEDVWCYIRENNLPYCKLYDDGWRRIGCIFCPMGSVQQHQNEARRYNGKYEQFVREFDRIGIWKKFDYNGLKFDSAEDCVNWYLYNTKYSSRQWLELKKQTEIKF